MPTIMSPTKRQVLAAQSKNRMAEVTNESYEDEETRSESMGAATTHTGPGLVRLYAPTPYGWKPLAVPVSNLDVCLDGGYRIDCGNCGGQCDGADENGCPAVAARMFRRCPVCQKRVFDPGRDAEREEETGERDPNEIVDDAYIRSTPESRTRRRLDLHMLAFHKEEAGEAGIVDTQPDIRVAARKVTVPE